MNSQPPSKELFNLPKLIEQFEAMAAHADQLRLTEATSIDKQTVAALRAFAHVRGEFEVVQALFGKGDSWREITASQIHDRMSEIMLELTKLQVKVKRYEPVDTYNGLTIEQWKARAEAAEAASAHEPSPALDFVAALKIAEAVFDQYRQDQLRWWKKMDGTPILNDVAVRMAEAFRKAVPPDDTLMLRSVGAMAIAEGDEGWDRVPIDCPMLAAVAKLRRDYDTLRAGQPPGVLRDGGLRDLMLAMRAYVDNYDCADAAELEAKAFIMSQCDALTKGEG